MRFPVGINDKIVILAVLRLVVEHRVVELIEHPDRAVERHFHHDVDVWFGVSEISPLINGSAQITDELIHGVKDFIGFWP